MKIVFVTRKFPPSVGGLETAAFELYTSLANKHDVTLVKWGGTNKYLPFVYPWLLLRALYYVVSKKPDVLYLQDGMLAPMGVVIKFLTRVPVLLSVHGLDITYTSRLYQKMLKRALPKIDTVVAGSEWTVQQATSRFKLKLLEKITYGVNDVFYKPSTKNELIDYLLQNCTSMPPMIKTSRIVLTTGRLVERKGVAWFLENVMPALTTKVPNVLYVIAGDGQDRQKIEDIIAKKKLTKHVTLLGYVSPDVRNALYNVCDIFLMPNIPVVGDGEGFGLVAVEAASCGATIVGAKLEGIQDAVSEGKTGYLVPTKKQHEYLKVLERELRRPTLNPTSVRNYVLREHSWDSVAAQYGAVFATMVRTRR